MTSRGLLVPVQWFIFPHHASIDVDSQSSTHSCKIFPCLRLMSLVCLSFSLLQRRHTWRWYHFRRFRSVTTEGWRNRGVEVVVEASKRHNPSCTITQHKHNINTIWWINVEPDKNLISNVFAAEWKPFSCKLSESDGWRRRLIISSSFRCEMLPRRLRWLMKLMYYYLTPLTIKLIYLTSSAFQFVSHIWLGEREWRPGSGIGVLYYIKIQIK